MNASSAAAALAAGKTVVVLRAAANEAIVPSAAVRAVRPLPDTVPDHAAIRRAEGFQVLVDYVGIPAWMSVSPSLVAAA